MADTSFSVTPAGREDGNNPVAPGPNPQFFQIRFNGVDLGGPDATVIDFVGESVTVTRVGDVVTVGLG